MTRQIEIGELEGVEAAVELPTGVHPVAALFPMMTEDELCELAADIGANGLLNPIVLDQNGQLIDGRNRLEACRRAEVKPTFTTLNGHDPVEFILRQNIARRHMTPGQRAMAAIRANSEWVVGNDSSSAMTLSHLSRITGVPHPRLSEARFVFSAAPDLALKVLQGSLGLAPALHEAQERQQTVESEETRFAMLLAEDSTLAELVREGTLTLRSAESELSERKQKAREEMVRLSRRFDGVLSALDHPSIPLDDCAAQWLDANAAVIGEHADFSAARARKAAAVLLRYAEMKESETNA